MADSHAGADPTPTGPAHAGLVVVDKPLDWTSHDVVARVRRLAGTRKVGHAGTLDPAASGVLVLGVEKGTKLLTWLTGADKSYDAVIRLGASTLTDDAEGEITAHAQPHELAAVDDERLARAVAALTGPIQQVPSAVSAIKVNGRRSYARVRAGEDVELPARPVTVSEFTVHGVHRDNAWLDVSVSVTCSSGTYVRALARDLGADLGVGGHLTALRRTRVGAFTLEDAASLDQLEQSARAGRGVVSIALTDAARALFPVRELDAAEASDLSHGRRISAHTDACAHQAEQTGLPVACFAPDGTLVALTEQRGGRERRYAASVLGITVGRTFSPEEGAR